MPTLNQRVDLFPESGPTSVAVRLANQEVEDRRSLVRGIDPVEGGNYFRFVSFEDERSRFSPAQISVPLRNTPQFAFDSFVVQQVSRDDDEVFTVNYTNGDPVIDVFHRHPPTMSIQGIIPDTAAFYAEDPEEGVVHGYVGESLEVLRTIYEKRFRSSAGTGQKSDVRGYVEFVHKNRRDLGYLVRMVTERTGAQLDHATFTVDMFVVRSQFLDFRLPVIVEPEPSTEGLLENTPDVEAARAGFGVV